MFSFKVVQGKESLESFKKFPQIDCRAVWMQAVISWHTSGSQGQDNKQEMTDIAPSDADGELYIQAGKTHLYEKSKLFHKKGSKTTRERFRSKGLRQWEAQRRITTTSVSGKRPLYLPSLPTDPYWNAYVFYSLEPMFYFVHIISIHQTTWNHMISEVEG